MYITERKESVLIKKKHRKDVAIKCFLISKAKTFDEIYKNCINASLYTINAIRTCNNSYVV